VTLGENINSERPPAILPVFFVNKYKSSLSRVVRTRDLRSKPAKVAISLIGATRSC